MKKTLKVIGALSVASLISTSALSQITITGYSEVGFITGSMDGSTLQTANSKGFGSDTTLVIASKGKMTNGMEYEVNQTLQSDVVGNGVDAANVSPMTTRNIRLLPSKDVVLFYTYDGVYGGEIARTAVPVVTERVLDFTGATSIAEFIDVTSGTHAIGFDILNVGPAGRLSVAYAPSTATTQSQTSDRVFSATNYAGGNGNNQSGYSIGGTITPGPVRVAVGYTSINAKSAATAVDPRSLTAGISYTQAPLAVGVQRTKNDKGRKVPGTTDFEDVVDTIAGSFAVSKELTIGATYSRMERDTAGSATGPKLKVSQVIAAYNLGPVVVSAGIEKAENKSVATGAVPTNGADHTLSKIKVKANF